MARIGILTCSNATQDLGCSSASCLADLRKRHGSFADYPADEPIHLVGIINCPGCPTVIGPEKLLQRVRALTEFRIDAIHLTYCVKALCPFREKYKQALEEAFPKIRVVIGTHKERISADEFREQVKKLFCQPKKTMIDLILDKD
ncbi:MAG: CGGC domain-containing protein [Nitrospirae bacterium GWC1_57_7]|nr:MAG: CGGC domain-containing protein [Nitrospirae bacterium GWC1_57_7]